MSGQKIKMIFINKKGETEEQSVYTRAASNDVRLKLKALERELNIYTTKFTEKLSKDHKEVFEAQQKTNGDILKALDLHETISVEDLTSVMDMASELETKQVEVLIEEIQVIVDLKRTLNALQIEQLETEQGETVRIESKTKKVKIDEDEDEPENDVIEFDFWNSQDLGVLREAKNTFFQRVGI